MGKERVKQALESVQLELDVIKRHHGLHVDGYKLTSRETVEQAISHLDFVREELNEEAPRIDFIKVIVQEAIDYLNEALE